MAFRAKEYLEQIHRYDCVINNKLAEIMQWRELAISIGSQRMDIEKVKSSPKNKITEMVEKIDMLETELQGIIDEYIDKRREVIKVIEKVRDTDEYDLLYKYYVGNKRLFEISAEMKMSYDRAKHLHTEALKSVENILKGRK